MIVLENTNGGAVAAAITNERHRMGSPATGMVMTLLIISDEQHLGDVAEAARQAAREHPMRILMLVAVGGDGDPRLDAEISVGSERGPGEVAVLRMYGDLSENRATVAIPLLLPDTPIVALWTQGAPADTGDDPIGRHAQRRITLSMAEADPVADLLRRAGAHHAGDTDLAWAQITGWRSLLASVLDLPHDEITGVSVVASGNLGAGGLLASWLSCRLAVPATLTDTTDADVVEVRLGTESGDIIVRRLDERRASLTIPGRPDSQVALPLRTLGDMLTEELRRMDPDEVYAEALAALHEVVEVHR